MQWILEHLQVLFIVGGAVAYWLNQRRLAREKLEMEQELEREPTADEMDERRRRIQEEIRRRIAERQGRTLEDEPPPLVREAMPPPLPETPLAPSPRTVPVSVEDTPGAAELARVMDEQRRYAEALDRLELAERSRTAAPAPMTMAAYALPAADAAERSRRHTSPWAEALHERAALRRAFVLSEILGAPKALR